jgi:hypothetical protein
MIMAGILMSEGLSMGDAVHAALVQILSDDPEMTAALDELVAAYLPT